MSQPDYPSYRVDMNVSPTTNAWVLGQSALGGGTILRTLPTTGASLTELRTPDGNSRFISCTIGRGRTDELGQIQAGTAALVLDNEDGAFSPDNPASPYYPFVVPRRQIQVWARYDQAGPWQSLYYGYTDTITPLDAGPLDGRVQIGCIDWLGRAAGADVTLATAAQADLDRFVALVAAVGIDNLPTQIIGPTNEPETMAATNYTAVAGLTALQQITDTTRGTIYQDRNGAITYRTRYGRFSTVGPFHAAGHYFDQVGLNPSPLVCPYVEPLEYDLTLQNLANNVTVTGGDNVPHTAADAASQAAYGRVDLSLSLPLLSPLRAQALATTLLSYYATPRPKVHSLVIDGDAWANGGASPLWDTLFQLDLGDTVRVVKQQPADLHIDRTMFVEHIQHEIKAGNAGQIITLQLSDSAQAGPAPWVLGTSKLGASTFLVY